MTNVNKIIASVTLVLFVVGSVTPALAAAAALKAKGRAKFVLQGTVTTVAKDSLAVRVTNTSKNAKLFDNQDKTIAVGPKTRVSKNGKRVAFNKIQPGDKVRIFGIFEKKSGAITAVRWIKVLAK